MCDFSSARQQLILWILCRACSAVAFSGFSMSSLVIPFCFLVPLSFFSPSIWPARRGKYQSPVCVCGSVCSRDTHWLINTHTHTLTRTSKPIHTYILTLALAQHTYKCIHTNKNAH